MDAAIPVDAKNAPTEIWKTAQNAVSHSAHTHRCCCMKKNEGPNRRTLINLSTDSDQGHRLSIPLRESNSLTHDSDAAESALYWLTRADHRRLTHARSTILSWRLQAKCGLAQATTNSYACQPLHD
jgi:hypothetical protein